jgi:predicted TIM-barrel fold metal-dependent hydrolase
VSKVIPPNRLLWASDFPHLDILWDEESVTEELYERLGLLDDGVARQILGLNAQEVYGIDVEVTSVPGMAQTGPPGTPDSAI